MTYEEAIEFIRQSGRSGIVLGLEKITELLKRLNNPQDKLRIIHIAGTNGKGSTAAFITSILCAGGYRVGRFVSPAVFSYREIIQISEGCFKSKRPNGTLRNICTGKASEDTDEPYLLTEYIEEADIQALIGRIKPVCEDMVKEGLLHPTSFEIETAMMFLYMAQKQVDFLVLETGMGGRLDATNAISRPLCSVITRVSLDHMQYLGDTLEQIAGEKAGIMKADSVAVTCNQAPEVLSVFLTKANELNIPLIIADCGQAKNIRYYLSHTEFSYPDNKAFDSYKIRLLGKHQVQNAVLAIETAKILDKMGYNINKEAVKTGLWMAGWPGRFEQVSKDPDIFIDGAHNEEAALRLRDSIEIYFTNRRLIFMIGVLADKDYHSMLRILAPLADTIITLTPDNPRALPSEKLAGEAMKYCGKVMDGKNVRKALELAYKEAGDDGLILAFGSLSFLGNLTDALPTRRLSRED